MQSKLLIITLIFIGAQTAAQNLNKTAETNPEAAFCPPIQFDACSAPSKRACRPTDPKESIHWDSAQNAYLITGPFLVSQFNDPGSDSNEIYDPNKTYKVVVTDGQPKPLPDRGRSGAVQSEIQETANCVGLSELIYTQVYAPESGGMMRQIIKLQLERPLKGQPAISIYRANIWGNFDNQPLYLLGGTNLNTTY